MNFIKIRELMADLEDELVIQSAEEVMAAGGADAQEFMLACQEGMSEIGARFESGEYFVGDLVFAGELMVSVMNIIRTALTSDASAGLGKMLLCTVKDDLHDIGKNIVKVMFETAGFEVLDLGIDVAPEIIVEQAKANDINIIGLSGVLTLAIDSMKATVDAFKNAGLRNDVRIIIGGNPITQESCDYVGADAWAINPQDGVKICREWAANN